MFSPMFHVGFFFFPVLPHVQPCEKGRQMQLTYAILLFTI
jgi:hypothetical protein